MLLHAFVAPCSPAAPSFLTPVSPFSYHFHAFFSVNFSSSIISSRAWSSLVSLQAIPGAFSSWHIFALCLVINKVSLSLMDLLLTWNIRWSRSFGFIAIWFQTPPLSLLIYRCWLGSIANTSLQGTTSCLSDHSKSFRFRSRKNLLCF